MENRQGFIPKHGGYRDLISYQKAEIVYDGTVYFVNRFYRKPDRTIDQMVQAARSGKQNIVEARMASATSKETEIKKLLLICWQSKYNILKTIFWKMAVCGKE